MKPEQRPSLHREFGRGGTPTPDERLLAEATLKHGSVEAAMRDADPATRLALSRVTGQGAPTTAAAPELPAHLAKESPGDRRLLLDNWKNYHVAESEIRRLRGINLGGSANLVVEIGKKVRDLQAQRSSIRHQHPVLRLQPDAEVDVA